MDLSDMDAVDAGELVAGLATADVVILYWPDGGWTTIRSRERRNAAKEGRDLHILRMWLSDTSQAELVDTALHLLEHRREAQAWGPVFKLIGEISH